MGRCMCGASDCRPCRGDGVDLSCKDCGDVVDEDTVEDTFEARCEGCATEYRTEGVTEALNDIDALRVKVARRKYVYRGCQVCMTATPFRLTAFGPDGVESVDLCTPCLAAVQSGLECLA